jgi:hypothetical protein
MVVNPVVHINWKLVLIHAIPIVNPAVHINWKLALIHDIPKEEQ